VIGRVDRPARRRGPAWETDIAPAQPVPRPRVICAADLEHAPEARLALEQSFDVCYVPGDAEAIGAALAQAQAYYATLHARLTDAMMAAAPGLRAITTPSTGLDHLDLDAAAARGIAVLSLKDDRAFLDGITATAELTWALLLACSRQLPPAVEAARRGDWARDRFRGHQLAGKTCGILGCGRLGTMVAQYARAFRMEVIACDLEPVELSWVEQVSMDELLARSDVLSLHVHLTEANRGLLGATEFARLKPGAVLLNTSRGAIVDEAALLAALEDGRLAAAGLDVIEGEWRDDLADHPLIRYAASHANLVITPHVGGVTYESQALAFEAAARKLVDFFTDTPRDGKGDTTP